MTTDNVLSQIQEISTEMQKFTQEYEASLRDLQQSVFEIKSSQPTQPYIVHHKETDSFGEFVRDMETKSLSFEDNPDSGMVRADYTSRINELIHTKCLMRQLASVETISSNALDIMASQKHFEAGWVTETAQRPNTDTTPILHKKILVHELYAQPCVSQQLLEDSHVDVSSWVMGKIADAFAQMENAAFINGDGQNKPIGILHYQGNVVERVAVAEARSVSVDDILNLMNSMDEEHIANATFLMHRSTLIEIQKLRDRNERFIWQPKISEKIPETIFGIPVACCNQMPRIEEGALPVVLADFRSAYRIVDRKGMTILKDPFTQKPFVKFYATKRVGADVVNPNAIKMLAMPTS